MFNRGLLVFLALTMACHAAQAGTIASISDLFSLGGGPSIFSHFPPPNDTLDGQFGIESWTQSQTYTNVLITATLSLWLPSNGAYHGAAYLTNSTGPGTTTAIASASFTGANTSPQIVQLFSGLTLGPGTYYLTLAGLDLAVGGQPGYIWGTGGPIDGALFQSVTAPGVTIAQDDLACNYPTTTICSPGNLNYIFPPASTFVAAPGLLPYFQFSVASAPEPSTGCLLAVGFFVLGLLLRKNAFLEKVKIPKDPF